MNQTCENAAEFLSGLVTDLRFDLTVSSKMTEEGCLLDLSGEDAHYALAENGELLDAFEVLLFQVMGRELDREHRFVVDADGFRADPQGRASRNGAFCRRSGPQERPAVYLRCAQFDRATHHSHVAPERRRPIYRIGR